ncbi:MAG: phospholipid carrier-dependent glycosyltransferase [Planctomycetota bacterium]
MQKRLSSACAPLALAGFIFLVYLFCATRSTLWDRDEPRYAWAGVEMLHSGNYLYPVFNGVLRPDKPILMYWLMTVPLRWWGATELACRFCSVLGVVAACLLTYLCGRFLFSARAGLWAMAILAATPQMVMDGTAAIADAVLLACTTAAMTVFLHSLRSRFTVYHALLTALALGAALLEKAPVGAAVLLPAMAVTWWFARGQIQVGWRAILYALLATLAAGAIFLCWAVPADRVTGGEFFRQFWGHHVAERMLRPLEGHGGNFLLTLPIYIPVVVALFLPWTLFLPGALSALAGARLAGPVGKWFLRGWLVPFFLIMSLAATKLPHYILPLWPALALAVAGTIDAHERRLLTPRDCAWLRRGAWLAAPLVFLLAFLLIAGTKLLPALAAGRGGSAPLEACAWVLASEKWPCAAAGAALAVLGFVALRQHLALRIQAAARTCFAGAIGMLLFFATFMLPAVEKLKVSAPLARAIRAQTAEDVPVATCEYAEPSLIFYLNRGVIHNLAQGSAVIAWAREPQPGVLIIPRDILPPLQRRYGDLGLREIASASGFNYSKGTWCDLVAVRRGP